MDNAPSIARRGILSFNALRENSDLRESSVSIADPFVNNRREGRQLDGRSLHDFVPLYWATHTPMQYVVTDQRLPQEDLVFFVLEAERILDLPGVWTTDGNAASRSTTIYPGRGALQSLDWVILRTRNCFSSEYKRKKCAAVLVPDRIGPDLFARICVHSDRSRVKLCERIIEQDNVIRKLPLITVDRTLYY